MKKKLVKTACGIPVGEAIRLKDGEPALKIKQKGNRDVITLRELARLVEQQLNTAS